MLSLDATIDATLEAGRRLDSWDNIIRDLGSIKPDYLTYLTVVPTPFTFSALMSNTSDIESSS